MENRYLKYFLSEMYQRTVSMHSRFCFFPGKKDHLYLADIKNFLTAPKNGSLLTSPLSATSLSTDLSVVGGFAIQ